MSSTGTFIGVSLALGLGMSIILSLAFKSSILASWDESRCKPGVVALAAIFKPDTDMRTGSQFAADNWAFCQKQYIESAIRTATTEVQSLSNAQGDIAAIAGAVVDGLTSTFTKLWSMCYQAYAIVMDRFKSAAKLMRNMMINMYAIVDRLQSVMFSVAMSLVSLVMAAVNTVQVTLIVATIIIGIILILQVVLFYIFAPISGLILTVSTLVLASAVIATTAITAAMIGNACFTGDTRVLTQLGPRPIREIRIGDVLETGHVTAIHRFIRKGPLYNLYGIHVSGSHLVWTSKGLIPVSESPDVLSSEVNDTDVYCLTTTDRKIPVLGLRRIVFADWEEIPESDQALETWYKRVYEILNGPRPTPKSIPDLSHEAGFSPETRVTLENGEKVPAFTIKLGDRLIDGEVIGITLIEATDTILVNGNWISTGTWVLDPVKQTWDICGSKASFRQPLIHFYTTSGIVTLNGLQIRDASEVGLDVIGSLVDEIVCPG
jgi:hypothetical protein